MEVDQHTANGMERSAVSFASSRYRFQRTLAALFPSHHLIARLRKLRRPATIHSTNEAVWSEPARPPAAFRRRTQLNHINKVNVVVFRCYVPRSGY